MRRMSRRSSGTSRNAGWKPPTLNEQHRRRAPADAERHVAGQREADEPAVEQARVEPDQAAIEIDAAREIDLQLEQRRFLGGRMHAQHADDDERGVGMSRMTPSSSEISVGVPQPSLPIGPTMKCPSASGKIVLMSLTIRVMLATMSCGNRIAVDRAGPHADHQRLACRASG